MSTNADTSAELKATLNLQRKAAITRGGAFDHAGQVTMKPLVGFDMGRTIFGGLTGSPASSCRRSWPRKPYGAMPPRRASRIPTPKMRQLTPAPVIDQRLIDFMVDECDFSMEHADGTFLEHLVFCHDYSARHYPDYSPNVALLHSILGTATNTFAMGPEKIPKLNELLTDFEALHVESFPSTLRLFYDAELMDELERNMHRLDQLEALHCHRVIDNEPLTLDADNLWINLNYHLMHFVDFMPAANWATHRNDPLLQMFERLSNLLDNAGQRNAQVDVTFPDTKIAPVGEARSLFGRVSGLLPRSVTLKLARKSIQEYSEKAGHDLSYQLDWQS